MACLLRTCIADRKRLWWTVLSFMTESARASRRRARQPVERMWRRRVRYQILTLAPTKSQQCRAWCMPAESGSKGRTYSESIPIAPCDVGCRHVVGAYWVGANIKDSARQKIQKISVFYMGICIGVGFGSYGLKASLGEMMCALSSASSSAPSSSCEVTNLDSSSHRRASEA
eukprot:3605641-Rhodomonas_salina.1